MKKGNITNPLRRRIPRELRGDWRKYLLVGFFLILTIGFVSGMYVANNSMLQAAENGKTTYHLEDGHFETSEKLSKEDVKAIENSSKDEKVPVRIYENFFRNETESDGTVRVFPKTEEINQACLLDGEFPQEAEEIAIDRMHADNAGIQVGDSIYVGGVSYKVVGLLAYVNYSTLHEKTTDLMFDAIKFDVAMVTEEGFERLESSIHYTYAWEYAEELKDETEEKKMSEDFLETVVTELMTRGNSLEDYVPGYSNPAVHFATEDMGSDKAMGGVLLDILIVIIAFIFAVTISNTIAREASTIGTLRALGYTRGELVRHFLAMPVIVTILSALVGNVLGYTVFKNVVVSMYYNSYSLPTYQTLWTPDAFIKTTVVPACLMLVVNLFIISRMMCKTPLQFLRHDLKTGKRKKAMRLPKWKFFSRFRLRIIFQNVTSYLILFVGIFFVMVLLAMAVGMPSTLSYYQKHTQDMMFAKYQYVLKSTEDESGAPISTKQKEAEPFGMYALQKENESLTEEVSVYGIVDDSDYVEIEDFEKLNEKEVYISESYRDKYQLAVGDTIRLDEKYEKKQYEFKICGIYDQCQSIAVFMPLNHYREIFDLDEDAFTGYFSDEKITDLPDEQVASVITEREITKVCDQLNHSMGSYMTYFQYLCVMLSAVLIYLLTKLIIEKNETAISMTKILGYENREIASLYLTATTLVVIVEAAVSVVLGTIVMSLAWRMIMFSYSGWYAFRMEPIGYVKMYLFVLLGYLIVMYFDFKRIKKIPMDQALKHVE